VINKLVAYRDSHKASWCLRGKTAPKKYLVAPVEALFTECEEHLAYTDSNYLPFRHGKGPDLEQPFPSGYPAATWLETRQHSACDCIRRCPHQQPAA
jgi:hypothetical protein